MDYNGSAQSAVVVGSVAGVVSDIKYDGSSTAPTNAGTYAVTADFVPTDTINYNNLSDAPAGNFVINKVDATVVVTPYSVAYDGSPHTSTGSAKGVLDEDLSGLDLSGTTHTEIGAYNDAWTFTDETGNYNDASGAVDNLITLVVPTTGTLIVKKVVINDNGGTKDATDFSFSVNGGDLVSFEEDGQNDITVAAGSYSVTENTDSGYTTTYENCSEVDVSLGGTATCVITNDDIAMMCEDTDVVQTVVSNVATQVDEHDALLIEPHPAYVSISGASWIWSDASMLDDDEVMSAAIGTKVFTKTFSVVGTPLDSMLEVAADNTYTVMVNGNTLDTGTSGTDSDNFTTVDSWTVPASMLVTGSNTITFTVENQTKPEGYTGVNPAGLLYKLTVHQNECVTPEPPEPTYVKVHIFKYLKNVESISQVGDESGLPSFPMTASWNADIGEGTGDYVLGNNHGGATLKYSADTSSMLAPVASYSTYERTGVSEEGVANVLAVGAECVANTYRLVGYKTGGSLESALLMEASTTAPTFTNFSTDQYVIVVNEDCDDVMSEEEKEDNTGTLIIKKIVVNDQEGTKNATDFSFSVNGGEYIQFTDDEDEDTMTAQNTLILEAGVYNVTESEVEDYINFSSEGCTDIVIVKGESKTCTFINYDHPEMVPGSGSNGAGGGQNLPPTPQVLGASTENTTEENNAPKGEVLGETTCSTIYLNDFLFFRRKNNPEQVKLLQAFLNEHMGLTLVVDGFYGKSTRDAVKAFQVKYADEVLMPWKPFGLKSELGTGNVYKTTKRKINMIKCADLNLPIPQLP